jgi:hypothetical protein
MRVTRLVSQDDPKPAVPSSLHAVAVGLRQNTWYLPLVADQRVVSAIRSILAATDTEIALVGDVGYLTSSAIARAKSVEDAIYLGEEIILRVNTVHAGVRGSELKVKIDHFPYFDDGGTETFGTGIAKLHAATKNIIDLFESLDPSSSRPNRDPPAESYTDVQEVLTKAGRYPEVWKALCYLRDGDYGSLYKLYEIIKSDVGKDEDLTGPARQYIDRSILRRIKHNLNDPAISGDLARHAQPFATAPRPADRMTPAEITQHLRALLLRWVADKA